MMLARAQAHCAPLAERGDDLYETPPEATRALLKVEMLRAAILCHPCNGMLGFAKDSRDTLLAAIEYLAGPTELHRISWEPTA